MAGTTVGSQLITEDGVLGISGQAKTVYAMHLLSGATAGIVKLRNGTAVTSTIYVQQTAPTVSTGNTFVYEDGFFFPAGCYVDVDANVTSVLLSYKEF